jgi:hypothetical protein
MANILAEALEPGYTLLDRNKFLRPMACLIDCKSLYDHANGVTSPSTVSDKLTSIEITILRELRRDSGIAIKWGPGALQLADGLTKDKEEPAVRLRGAVRAASFQMSSESEVLRNNKLEKERKALRKAKQAEQADGKTVTPA